MQNASILPKCNKFRIALQWFYITQHPGFIYVKKKNQLYIFPIVGLCFFARYKKWERWLYRSLQESRYTEYANSSKNLIQINFGSLLTSELKESN